MSQSIDGARLTLLGCRQELYVAVRHRRTNRQLGVRIPRLSHNGKPRRGAATAVRLNLPIGCSVPVPVTAKMDGQF